MPVEYEIPAPARVSTLRRISLVLRRTHMYVALFLTPWMAMYALSTIVFNHNRLFQGEQFSKEREVAYTRTFPEETAPDTMAREIRRDLGLRGNLRPTDSDDDSFVFVEDGNPIHGTHQLTYVPADKKIVVEKQAFRISNLLTWLHSRVGYGRSRHSVAWAISVDLSIFASVLWIFSGFWMWWELKVTRRWGALFALAGPAIFAALWVLG